ncbi:MAG: hypothetical protein SOV27_04145 [Eubacteriales bacterium]|nr:hypothetical protein [Eubacteriales bacterium]
MEKRVLLYSENFDNNDCEDLDYLKISHITCICGNLCDIASKMNHRICILLVGNNCQIDNNILKGYLPKDHLPQIFNLKELVDLKKKYYTNMHKNKNIFYCIQNFLQEIKISPTSISYAILKYSLNYMLMYNIKEFSYRLLKLLSCFFNKDYNSIVLELRQNLHNILIRRKSNFLNRVLCNDTNNKIYLLNAINYCYQKYINNERLYTTNKPPPQYSMEYYIQKSRQHISSIN